MRQPVSPAFSRFVCLEQSTVEEEATWIYKCSMVAASGCDTSNKETSIYSYGMIAGCRISSPGRWKVRVDFNPTNNIVDLYFVKNNCDAKPWDNTARIKKWGGAVSETVEFDVTDADSTYCFVLDNNNWGFSAVTEITLQWTNPVVCTPTGKPKADWVVAQTCAGAQGTQTLTLKTGVSKTDSTERTNTWSIEVQAKASAGFSFGPLNAGVETSVTNAISTEWKVAKSITETRETESSYTSPPGVVWQFALDVQDTCGTARVSTYHVVTTNSIPEKPCCLPGYFRASTIPHGPCRVPGMCTCGPAVCATTTPPPTPTPVAPCPYGAGTFTSQTGTISIPSSYSNRLTCDYRISTGTTINLRFSSFSTESDYDYVEVYDGSSTSGTSLGSFSGTSIPGTQTANSGSMFIRFTSDSGMSGSGVSMSWTSGGACELLIVMLCSVLHKRGNRQQTISMQHAASSQEQYMAPGHPIRVPLCLCSFTTAV